MSSSKKDKDDSTEKHISDLKKQLTSTEYVKFVLNSFPDLIDTNRELKKKLDRSTLWITILAIACAVILFVSIYFCFKVDVIKLKLPGTKDPVKKEAPTKEQLKFVEALLKQQQVKYGKKTT